MVKVVGALTAFAFSYQLQENFVKRKPLNSTQAYRGNLRDNARQTERIFSLEKIRTDT